MDKDGNRMYIKKDANGKEYFVNSNGQKQIFVNDPLTKALQMDDNG